MLLQIKNKDLFFVVETIWGELDYRFKYQLNQLVIANSTDDYVQTIDCDVSTLMQCYDAIQSKAYGCTVGMADTLLEDIKTQLLANMQESEYNEAIAEFLTAKNKSDELYAAKCLSGKLQILA